MSISTNKIFSLSVGDLYQFIHILSKCLKIRFEWKLMRVGKLKCIITCQLFTSPSFQNVRARNTCDSGTRDEWPRDGFDNLNSQDYSRWRTQREGHLVHGPGHREISDFTWISSFRMKNVYAYPLLDRFRIRFPIISSNRGSLRVRFRYTPLEFTHVLCARRDEGRRRRSKPNVRAASRRRPSPAKS